MTGVLVDTSVWAQALRKRGDPGIAATLAQQVTAGSVRVHPWVLGELVLGGLSADARGRLEAQRCAPVLAHDEVMALVDARALARIGIGWVDAQLLACASVHRLLLWTLDRSLADAARILGCAYTVP